MGPVDDRAAVAEDGQLDASPFFYPAADEVGGPFDWPTFPQANRKIREVDWCTRRHGSDLNRVAPAEAYRLTGSAVLEKIESAQPTGRAVGPLGVRERGLPESAGPHVDRQQFLRHRRP